MDLLVLCGGKASRLGTLANEVPKILVEVAGRPFLHYLLAQYARHFDRLVLLAGYLGEILRIHESPGLTVLVEPEPLDTGGAVVSAIPHVSPRFAVVNGDTYLEGLNIASFLEATRQEVAAILLTEDERQERGGVEVDGTKVVTFREKSEAGRGFVHAGLAVLERSALVGYAGRVSFERTILPELARMGKLGAQQQPVTIYDMGTPAGLARLQQHLQGDRA